MHKDDQMTPNERMAAYVSGKEFDRLPIMPFVNTYSVNFGKMSCREKRSSPQNLAKCLTSTYEALGCDILVVEYGPYGLGGACGAVKTEPENNIPTISKTALSSFDELEKLNLECVYRKNDPWFQLNYNAAELLLEQVGNEVATCVTIPGAITAATGILPIDVLLRATIREPEKIHKLFRFCTDAIKIVMDDYIKLGITLFMCDPVASMDVISPKNYREFVWPYTEELMQYAIDQGSGMGYHVCGHTKGLVPDMVKLSTRMISLDSYVDLAYVKEQAGHKMTVCGAIDVINTLMFGTREDVFANMRSDLEKAWDSPFGFIPCSSCDMPISAPIENVYAIMESGRKYCKGPLNPENWRCDM